jgi:hypothetical protein
MRCSTSTIATVIPLYYQWVASALALLFFATFAIAGLARAYCGESHGENKGVATVTRCAPREAISAIELVKKLLALVPFVPSAW